MFFVASSTRKNRHVPTLSYFIARRGSRSSRAIFLSITFSLVSPPSPAYLSPSKVTWTLGEKEKTLRSGPAWYCYILPLFSGSGSLVFYWYLYYVRCILSVLLLDHHFPQHLLDGAVMVDLFSDVRVLMQRWNSWKNNFVEVSGNNLEISQTWGFYLCFCLFTRCNSWTNLSFIHWLIFV